MNDLQQRTLAFAKSVRIFLMKRHRVPIPFDDRDQLIRSSGSIGANYVEAQEAFTRKDFFYHIRISRKEAKESLYWLDVIEVYLDPGNPEFIALRNENIELIRILVAIAKKSENSLSPS